MYRSSPIPIAPNPAHIDARANYSFAHHMHVCPGLSLSLFRAHNITSPVLGVYRMRSTMLLVPLSSTPGLHVLSKRNTTNDDGERHRTHILTLCKHSIATTTRSRCHNLYKILYSSEERNARQRNATHMPSQNHQLVSVSVW